MEDKEIIVSITVPDEQVKKATKSIQENVEAIEKLKTEQEILAKTVGKTDAQYIKNAATLKQLTTEVRQNERTLIAAEKAQRSNGDSVVALREQLSAATSAYINLSAAERNSAKGQELQKKTKALSDQLKGLEKNLGDNRRNVGNYSEALSGAVKAQGGAASSALGLFRTLQANPFMLIATIIASLIAKVSQMQGVMDAVNKVMVPLNMVFSRFVGILQQVIDGIINALSSWENLKAAFSNFSWKGLVEGAKDFADQLKEAAKDGERLVNVMKALDDMTLNYEKNIGELNRRYDEQVQKSKNVLATEQERKAAAEEAIKIDKQRVGLQLAILNQEIAQAQIKSDQAKDNRKEEIELQKLINKRTELLNESAKRQGEIALQQSRLEKQLQGERNQRAKAAKSEEERIAREQEQQERERTKVAQQEAQRRLEASIAQAQADSQFAINQLKQQYLDGTILKEDYENQLNELTKAALIAREAILDEFDLTEQEKQLVGAEFESALRTKIYEQQISQRQAILDFDIAATEKEIENAKKVADAKAAEEKKLAALKMQAANTALNNTLDVLGRESAAGRAVASFQAALNAYQAFNAALAQPLPPPIPQILAATNLASGLAQVARINATPPPRFATGVIGLEGPGTATSDSIEARLSRGESVITAKATSAFAPVLAEMEKAVGNRPNFNYRSGRFAGGVIGSNGIAANFANLSDSRAQAATMDSRPIVVKVTDIDKVNSRRARAARVTEIS
jgi:hypothetical protein